MLRSPLLRFLLIGALLFALRDRLFGSDADRAGRIEIDAGRIEEIRSEFRTETGRSPSPAELEGLVAHAVDEDLLYREALVQGLDERDGGIETRLVQKMLFLDDTASLADAAVLLERARALGLDQDDLVIRRLMTAKLRLLSTALDAGEVPTEVELTRRYAEQREALREPDRRSLIHVFLSRDRRRERCEVDAAVIGRRITAERLDGETAMALSDPFPAGSLFALQTHADLERLFGSGFADASFELAADRWSEPIPSAYGLHLVRIDAIVRGEIPAFETVRERLRLALEEEIRARKLAALLATLRTRYEVAVTWPGEDRR